MNQTKIILFALLLTTIMLKGRDYTKDDFQITLAVPDFSYFSSRIDQKGTSFSFSYPGFHSVWGQLNFYYTTANHSSYYIGLVLPFTAYGTNQYVKYFDCYLNLQFAFGNIDISKYQAYQAGLSKIVKLNEKSKVELTLDLFLHHGYNGEFIFGRFPYTKGIKWSFNYSYELSKEFVVSFNTGLAYNQRMYTYWEYENGTHEDSDEQEALWYEAYKNGAKGYWDNYFSIPISVSLNYKF